MKHLLPVAITAAFLGGCATAPVATFHTTTKTGNVESVKQLLANGADVNVKNASEWTPLHIAAQFGHVEMVELLLSKGANVNAMNLDGNTPQDLAKGETADLLRKHGGKTGEELKAAGN